MDRLCCGVHITTSKEKHMSRIIPVSLFSLCAILALTFVTSAQEQSVKRSQVPKAILEAFAKAYPNATMKGFSKETENKQTVYEVESVEGKTSRDITYAADGTVISLEESMPFSALPATVQATFKKEFAKAEIRTCEKVVEQGTTKYELLVITGSAREEVVLGADGAILAREKKNSKENKD
jgi:hypothetical protein